MLRFIRIQNLAVIESTQVEFSPGFNVLTGETGAGKSIVADAVDLLLGGRASSDLVRTGQAQATIEAAFEASGRELVIRREITAQGRSRAFVDGLLVTASQLRDTAGGLVDLHGQHEQQRLLDPDTHLETLDQFGGLLAARAVVAERWAELRRLREAFSRASMDARERGARLEWLAFQIAEFDAVQPRGGEDETLLGEKQVLLHADRVQRLCREGYDLLVEQEGSALSTLGGVWKRVDELAQIGDGFGSFADGRGGVADFLDDLARTFRSTGEAMEDAGDRLARVEDRLARLDRLKRQHGPTMTQVLERWRGAVAERDQLQEARAPQALEGEVSTAERVFLASARALSRQRRDAASRLGLATESALARLGMAHTRFTVRFEPELASERWSERGVDAAEFFVSANVGEDVRPLAKVASGGELSRIMLALHAVGLEADPAGEDDGAVPQRTLIFDEVDAGIGGAVADAVGERLRALGDRFQVICITHLPGIAARADAHFAVEKETLRGRTVTRARPITGEERIGEIGRMLAGSQRSEAVRATAKELLDSAAATGESQRDGKRRKRKSQRTA
jgi:DNA repair protein RecN (Recombination protein N)